MVKQAMRGVNGVLGNLLSGDSEPIEYQGKKQQSRIRARVGRPPASPSEALSREKMTVRISPELIDEYRDWSWDARKPLSRLVEAALVDYRKSRGN
jgi:hypothetical protein